MYLYDYSAFPAPARGVLNAVHVDPRSCNGGEKGKEKCDTILSIWNFIIFLFIQLFSFTTKLLNNIFMRSNCV